MRMFKGKRGFDNFTILLTIFAMIALTLILVSVIIKYNNISRTFGGAGSNAVSLLGTYEKADYALLYLDNAARLSAEQAAYESGMSGFYGGDADNSDGYVFWSLGSVNRAECKASFVPLVPTQYGVFNGYFTQVLNSHIAAYNQRSDVKLIQNNYDKLELSQVSGGLEVLGTAISPVVVSGRNVEYKVFPSFREWIGLDFVGNFKKVTEKASAIVGTGMGWLTRSKIQNAINGYNNEDNSLSWNVAFDSACANQCVLGSSCFKCRYESTVEGKKRICDIPGTTSRPYCIENAKISVKVTDEKYRNGYKGFVSASGFVPYEYRFDLNWVEMKDIECCNGNGCSSDYE